MAKSRKKTSTALASRAPTRRVISTLAPRRKKQEHRPARNIPFRHPAVISPAPPSAERDVSTGIIFRDDVHRASFNRLTKRPVISTKFIDGGIVAELGLWEGVRALFENIGWGVFLRLKSPTYKRLTLEALSSISSTVDGVAFRLLNTDVKLTLNELGTLFGFPEIDRDARHIKPTSNPSLPFPKNHFWASISGKSSFEPRHSKASSIVHPCLRIIHRSLSGTLFGRTEMGSIITGELYLLWGMTRSPYSDEGSYPSFRFDFAWWLRDRLLSSAREVSEIHCGGFFTEIAVRLGLELPHRLEEGKGDEWLGIHDLIRAGILFHRGKNHWLYKVAGNKFCVLPHPQISRVLIPGEEWLLPAKPSHIPSAGECAIIEKAAERDQLRASILAARGNYLASEHEERAIATATAVPASCIPPPHLVLQTTAVSSGASPPSMGEDVPVMSSSEILLAQIRADTSSILATFHSQSQLLSDHGRTLDNLTERMLLPVIRQRAHGTEHHETPPPPPRCGDRV